MIILSSILKKNDDTWQKKARQQGLKRNQGPEVKLAMMLLSLRKECSVLLCEAVQGDIHVYFTYLSYITCVVYVI